MNKKILIDSIILSIIIFGGVFLSFQSAQAGILQFGDKNIFVDFDGLPFNLSNFAPGMSSLPKIITITNNENFDINVYLKAKKTSGDDVLADTLTVTIDNKLKHLSGLFTDNIILASIDSEKSRDYTIAVNFDSNAGNEYQDKSINFDFVIIVEQIGGEEESEEVTIPGGGPGGGGGGVPTGLIVFNEESKDPSTVAVTLTWFTNRPATSRIIYDTISHPLLGPAPDYGYAYSTTEDSTKVTFHSVIISNLAPETIHYWRAISIASPPTISQEHSFTTLAVGEVEEKVNQPAKEAGLAGKEVSPLIGPTEGELVVGPAEGEEESLVEGELPTGAKKEEQQQEEIGLDEEEPAHPGFFNNLLGAIGGLGSNLASWLIVLAIILLVLVILIFIKKRKQKD